MLINLLRNVEGLASQNRVQKQQTNNFSGLSLKTLKEDTFSFTGGIPHLRKRTKPEGEVPTVESLQEAIEELNQNPDVDKKLVSDLSESLERVNRMTGEQHDNWLRSIAESIKIEQDQQVANAEGKQFLDELMSEIRQDHPNTSNWSFKEDSYAHMDIASERHGQTFLVTQALFTMVDKPYYIGNSEYTERDEVCSCCGPSETLIPSGSRHIIKIGGTPDGIEEGAEKIFSLRENDFTRAMAELRYIALDKVIKEQGLGDSRSQFLSTLVNKTISGELSWEYYKDRNGSTYESAVVAKDAILNGNKITLSKTIIPGSYRFHLGEKSEEPKMVNAIALIIKKADGKENVFYLRDEKVPDDHAQDRRIISGLYRLIQMQMQIKAQREAEGYYRQKADEARGKADELAEDIRTQGAALQN